MATRKKLSVIHGGRASDAEMLRSMKTYQLRMLLQRDLPAHEERMVREELARRKATANDPSPESHRRETERHFYSKMEAIEFANERLGPDYEVVSRTAGRLRLKRRKNGAIFVLTWPAHSRDAQRPRRLPGPKPKMTYAVYHPLSGTKRVYRGLVNKDKAHRQAMAWAKRFKKGVRLTVLSSNAEHPRPFTVTAKGKWQSTWNGKAKPKKRAATKAERRGKRRQPARNRFNPKDYSAEFRRFYKRGGNPDDWNFKANKRFAKTFAKMTKAEALEYRKTGRASRVAGGLWQRKDKTRFLRQMKADGVTTAGAQRAWKQMWSDHDKLARRSSRRDPDDFFVIMVYGDWGSEPYSTAKTLESAMAKALAASKKDPKNEYCVEIEPGGFDNPLYKNGRKIQ